MVESVFGACSGAHCSLLPPGFGGWFINLLTIWKAHSLNDKMACVSVILMMRIVDVIVMRPDRCPDESAWHSMS